jgi:glucokinase
VRRHRGPVVDGRVLTTNLPWLIDERRLAETVPSPRARLLNDLEATSARYLGFCATTSSSCCSPASRVAATSP